MATASAFPEPELKLLREVVGPGPVDEILAIAWRQSSGDLAAAVNMVWDGRARLNRRARLDFPKRGFGQTSLAPATINLDDDSEDELETGVGAPTPSASSTTPATAPKEAPVAKRARPAQTPSQNIHQEYLPSSSFGITLGYDWTFHLGTLNVQGYATNRLRTDQLNQSNSGTQPLLRAGLRLEMRWTSDTKRLKGRPGSADTSANRESGSIRFDMGGMELGKFPANTSRVLVPLLSRNLVTIEAFVGDSPPVEILQLGTSIPVDLCISLHTSALQAPGRTAGLATSSSHASIVSSRGCHIGHGAGLKAKGHKAVMKEEAETETQRSATAQLLSMLGLPRRRPDLAPEISNGNADDSLAAPAAARATGDEEIEDEEESHVGGEMPAEVASQLGCQEALERSHLPAVCIPEKLFRARLKWYQAQAVFWMWQRENPTSKLPDGWLEEAGNHGGSSGSFHEPLEQLQGTAGRQLHPMWDEYKLPTPTMKLPGRAACTSQHLYHHRTTGTLSLDFPDAALAHCRGGVLADDMGLGKTVMCLALVSLDRAGPEVPSVLEDAHHLGAYENMPPAHKQNVCGVIGGVLVVAPVSLISQWNSEIQKHFPAKHQPSVHEYHGSGRRQSVEQLQSYSIVLTTYGTLSAEREDGPLFQVCWRRAILDEAHSIKNRCSRAAQAAFRIRALCRWCVTGTPLQNSIDELFSLIRFLGVDPWSSWAAWRKAVSIPLDHGRHGDEQSLQEALSTARRILQPLLLRRTKSSKNPRTGEPLLTLPRKHVHTVEMELSPPERDFYEALYAKAKAKFDTFVARGEALSMYTHIFALILRLRQALCHPFLVFARSAATDADMNALEQRCLREMVGSDGSDDRVPEKFVTSLLDDLRNGQLADCPICVEPPEDPTMTVCGHIFCRECALKAAQAWCGACPVCRREGALDKKSLKVLPGASRFPSRLLAKASATGKEEGCDEASAAYSTKMLELLKRLRVDVSEGHRAVVFSQWTSFLDLIGPSLEHAKIPCQRFDGSLSLEERRRRVAWLAEATSVGMGGRVLLCSLKSGGVGLNLVAASRLYLLDLWWNPAVEEQAIQRVHRIGQTSEVHIYKFVVNNSIDNDLLELQRAKSQLLENAMQDGSRPETASKLTLEDLKRIFRPCQSIKALRNNTMPNSSAPIDNASSLTDGHSTAVRVAASTTTSTANTAENIRAVASRYGHENADMVQSHTCWAAMPCDDV